jgi:methylated-DNA-[protein]-cysteine S-methyltransferase
MLKQADSGVFSVTVGAPFGAVGQACGANPFALPVPCRRGTAASSPGGFLRHATGFHVGVKRKLLVRE